ncbi:methylated-DNA--[protein]-cysteine S-methyltransferase [Pelagibius litoralis]|uniref:Methylated-DNA--protein-cysteine methyltransferase n=1 Tax=Pelagibius litoralis TaxID=374515 RepID=A0A967KAL1_9PROT|nr:methylated-DNA--[protein]-cysteine S-methyltransferase [Pelagibius litoralis]NIA71698.1 methylated-DNA--[protein]-cysteine S-methyltransferase [Pelagibius litoralis]
MTLLRRSVETPTGPVNLTEDDGVIIRVTWAGSPGTAMFDDTSPLLDRTAEQITAYFAGALQVFDLPLRPAGSDFQLAVWREMLRIPYGETRSYGDLAKATGGVARAVGGACGANPIPIIIPCHRVLGADRALGGFSGGLGAETKAELLTLEGAWPIQHGFSFA